MSRWASQQVFFFAPADRLTGIPADVVRLTLVRHGETEGQSSVRYYGRTDVPLSLLGRLQMERVRAALAGRRFAAVYSSRLSRSAEAARIITASGDGAPELTAVDGFEEIDFGEWEGLTAEEICERDPQRFAEWEERRGNFQYPGGESNGDFHARVAHSLRTVLAQVPASELLFVLHKGVIRCILAELLGSDDVPQVVAALGSIHILSRARDVWRADALDRTEHL